MTGNIWTPEMLVAFRELYAAQPEQSFDVIAATMSSAFDITLTRNACIGKAHRLGLPMRGHRTGPRKPHHPHTKRLSMIKVRVDAPIAPEMPKRGLQPFTLDIIGLRYGDCKWPSGAPMARPPFFYCGEPAVAGRPYCATHMDAAHSHWVRA